eukprot:gene32128-16651_t
MAVRAAGQSRGGGGKTVPTEEDDEGNLVLDQMMSHALEREEEQMGYTGGSVTDSDNNMDTEDAEDGPQTSISGVGDDDLHGNMADIAPGTILEELFALVTQELKVVSYKWLARNYAIPANRAKQILFKFAEQQRDKVKTTYLVSGWEKETNQHVFNVLDSAKLHAAREQLDPITSMHVYSVAPPVPLDPSTLWQEDFIQARELLTESKLSGANPSPSVRNFCANGSSAVKFTPEQCAARPAAAAASALAASAASGGPPKVLAAVVKPKQADNVSAEAVVDLSSDDGSKAKDTAGAADAPSNTKADGASNARAEAAATGSKVKAAALATTKAEPDKVKGAPPATTKAKPAKVKAAAPTITKAKPAKVTDAPPATTKVKVKAAATTKAKPAKANGLAAMWSKAAATKDKPAAATPKATVEATSAAPSAEPAAAQAADAASGDDTGVAASTKGKAAAAAPPKVKVEAKAAAAAPSKVKVESSSAVPSARLAAEDGAGGDDTFVAAARGVKRARHKVSALEDSDDEEEVAAVAVDLAPAGDADLGVVEAEAEGAGGGEEGEEEAGAKPSAPTQAEGKKKRGRAAKGPAGTPEQAAKKAKGSTQQAGKKGKGASGSKAMHEEEEVVEVVEEVAEEVPEVEEVEIVEKVAKPSVFTSNKGASTKIRKKVMVTSYNEKGEEVVEEVFQDVEVPVGSVEHKQAQVAQASKNMAPPAASSKAQGSSKAAQKSKDAKRAPGQKGIQSFFQKNNVQGTSKAPMHFHLCTKPPKRFHLRAATCRGLLGHQCAFTFVHQRAALSLKGVLRHQSASTCAPRHQSAFTYVHQRAGDF